MKKEEGLGRPGEDESVMVTVVMLVWFCGGGEEEERWRNGGGGGGGGEDEAPCAMLMSRLLPEAAGDGKGRGIVGSGSSGGSVPRRQLLLFPRKLAFIPITPLKTSRAQSSLFFQAPGARYPGSESHYIVKSYRTRPKMSALQLAGSLQYSSRPWGRGG